MPNVTQLRWSKDSKHICVDPKFMIFISTPTNEKIKISMRNFKGNKVTFWRKIPRMSWHISLEEDQGLQAPATQTWAFPDIRWTLHSPAQTWPCNPFSPVPQWHSLHVTFLSGHIHATVVNKGSVKAPVHTLKEWLPQKSIFNHVINQTEKENGGNAFKTSLQQAQ